jgi:hypothetical protein
MAGQSNADYLSQAVDGFASRVGEFADGIAGRLGGQPMSGTQLSKDEAVQRWNFSPLGSTDQADAAYHQLVMQGTPPGQALNQVYPMRSMLYQGADLQDAISTAKQIQGWAAEAAGQEPPAPFEGSTLPLSLAQRQMARTAAAPAAPQVVGPALPPLPQQNAAPLPPLPPVT